MTERKKRRIRKDSRYFEYNGETHTIREWADICGVTLSAMRKRQRAHLPPEKMFAPDRRINAEKYGKYKQRYYRALEAEVERRWEEEND